jgi:hypothetical protein
MTTPRARKIPNLEALPPDHRDLPQFCHPRLLAVTTGAGQPRPEPGLAPESALRLHPCRALSSAPVSTSVGKEGCFAKLVVVVDREN